VAGYFAARWVREAGIPTVGILHSDDTFYRGLQDEFVFGRQPYRVSALVGVSRELEKQVIERKPESTEIYRIPYGVSVPQLKAQRVPGRLRLAYVGRLAEEQKRISDLTRALCRVTRQVPDTEAVLYGDGPDRSNVEHILTTEGKGLPVRLAGRVDSDEMQSRLLDCDVLVLLSDYEGLPIAVLEAMACGVVPVCLRMRSGIPELVQHGVTGLVVDDREESFSNAIRRLQSEPDLLEKLSKAARHKIEVEYSDQACVRRWAELFHKLHAEGRDRKREIRVPGKLCLPPINPALASEDPRSSGPSRTMRLYRRGRIFVGKIKRKLLGQPIR
jgi:glycosyltransferase involved in cell wall biosynthesis